MKLNWTTLWTLFCMEIRMVLRDRRMILTSIVLPVLVMPLLLFGAHWTTKKREHKLQTAIYRYAVAGSETNFVRTLVAATRTRLASAEKSGKQTNEFHLEEVRCPNARVALRQGDIQFILEGLTATSTRVPQAKTAPATAETPPAIKRAPKPGAEESEVESGPTGAPVVRLVFRGDRDDSTAGFRRMQEALQDTRRAQQAALLKGRGFPLAPEQLAAVTEVNLASQGQVAGLALGRVMTLLLLFFILSSGAVVATDLLAGEKERGTLETLLTTAASRVDVVAAKHLVILVVAVFITLIQAMNLLLYLGFKFIPVPAGFAAAVPPWVALLLAVLFLPMAALAASVLLLTSGYARSYKEAQLYFFPVVLLGMVPALTPLLPDLPLRSAIVVVPVANLALAAKEILIGTYDWLMIAVSWLVTAAAAVWTTRLTVRSLGAEQLITAAQTDAIEFVGGPSLFRRHVWRWFAVLWGILLLASNYLGTADLRVQLAVNLVVFLFGASLLMIWRYHLPPREALALRWPRKIVFLAVLFAVPSGLLTGNGLFQLANLLFPVPQEMLEGFSEAVLPPNLSLAQILLFLAVLPGIFEEFAFRGLLLYGLHQRLRPISLALVVGVVFGFFHFAFFRFVPTAYLGILLATVTLLTGSIFPAMLWHALSNALAVLAGKAQIPLAELDPQIYLAAAVILGGALWIIWRNRTPYPGLRPWSSRTKRDR